ncbi:hypothetical protein DdX_19484 [Ditylenchus destructor]|uniref:Uncharacterized protein n=1 Tax=Ditylenchus destructor TaxID=166010 RepID=A0AAD4QXD3_9BILA|nr:hypothetical protein DdX_19484 [Ditylenchus destructor]
MTSAERKRKSRENQSPDARQRELEHQRKYDKIRRSNETEVETSKRKEQDRGNKRAAADWKTVEFYKMGKMGNSCKYCKAMHFKEEQKERTDLNSYNDCCNHGKIKLEDSFKEYPDEWKKLFVGNYPDQSSKLLGLRAIEFKEGFITQQMWLHKQKGMKSRLMVNFSFMIQVMLSGCALIGQSVQLK